MFKLAFINVSFPAQDSFILVIIDRKDAPDP